MNRSLVKTIALILCSSLAIGGLVTWLVETQLWWYGWLISSLLLAVSFTILFLLYRKAGSSRLLGWMIIASFILRLGLGVALMRILPIAGYDTVQQKAGYVFFDAYRRDAQAFKVAQSDKPLISVFSKQYSTDQYGGYLGLSVLVYRYISNGELRPQLMLILSALAAAVGVPFLWMILSHLGGGRWRKFAGWWYVLYPEAVLLGSSQMREPYLITFLTIVFWAALEWQQSGKKAVWIWLAGSLLGMLLFSPGIAVLSLIVIPVWMWLDRKDRKVPAWLFPVIFAVLVIGVVLLAYGVARAGHFAKNTPIETILNWIRNASAWDASITQRGSGQIDLQLQSLPDWMRIPFIAIYGILQPVLPATIMDPAIPVWRIISTWLALGWYLLFPLLIYGTFAIFRYPDKDLRLKFQWLALVIWSWIIISSIRAGGDVWDNPRYRTIILAFLVIFAAWAWSHARENNFVWLKRIALVEGVYQLFFLQWYAARYYKIFGKLPFFYMVGLIVGVSVLIIVGSICYDKVRASKIAPNHKE